MKGSGLKFDTFGQARGVEEAGEANCMKFLVKWYKTNNNKPDFSGKSGF
jgi:hypothetical protein